MVIHNNIQQLQESKEKLLEPRSGSSSSSCCPRRPQQCYQPSEDSLQTCGWMILFSVGLLAMKKGSMRRTMDVGQVSGSVGSRRRRILLIAVLPQGGGWRGLLILLLYVLPDIPEGCTDVRPIYGALTSMVIFYH